MPPLPGSPARPAVEVPIGTLIAYTDQDIARELLIIYTTNWQLHHSFPPFIRVLAHVKTTT
ncbi:hypothetical protein B0H13DRAFT_2330033 [Mycena leptocephala]|nr:hypothetical protein B0H13DRAFT_2330033 [Mycena leptocephala]